MFVLFTGLSQINPGLRSGNKERPLEENDYRKGCVREEMTGETVTVAGAEAAAVAAAVAAAAVAAQAGVVRCSGLPLGQQQQKCTPSCSTVAWLAGMPAGVPSSSLPIPLNRRHRGDHSRRQQQRLHLARLHCLPTRQSASSCLL